MKKIFCLLSVLLIAIACITRQPEKPEIKFINKAVDRARKQNKLIILKFNSSGSDASRRLDKDIFKNPGSGQFIESSFVLVEVSSSDPVYKALSVHLRLEEEATVVFLDQNGNEIDRSVNYNNDREGYMSFLHDVSRGRNLYSVVYSVYSKDTLNVYSNYILAKKYLIRDQTSDAIRHFNRVLLYDPYNQSGLYGECITKLAESRLIRTPSRPR